MARSPHGAGEIPQAIGRKQRRLVEGGNKERARQMSLMMLDAMELRSNFFRSNLKRLRKRLGDAHKSSHNLSSLARKARQLQSVQEFRSKARPGVARNGDVID